MASRRLWAKCAWTWTLRRNAQLAPRSCWRHLNDLRPTAFGDATVYWVAMSSNIDWCYVSSLKFSVFFRRKCISSVFVSYPILSNHQPTSSIDCSSKWMSMKSGVHAQTCPVWEGWLQSVGNRGKTSMQLMTAWATNLLSGCLSCSMSNLFWHLSIWLTSEHVIWPCIWRFSDAYYQTSYLAFFLAVFDI